MRCIPRLRPSISIDRNRINTYDFYNDRVYKLEEIGHDETDLRKAFDLALEWGERIPSGVFYRVERPIYGENFSALKGPLVKQRLDGIDLSNMLEKFA